MSAFSVFTSFKAKDGVTPVFQDMARRGNEFRSKVENIGRSFRSFTDKVFTLKNALMGTFVVVGIQKMWGALKGFAGQAIEAAKGQTQAETKLYAILKNVQSLQKQGPQAYKEAGDRLKDMATHLQRIGVLGDEVTLAAYQQLATFQLSDKEMALLSNGMTDLLAQQKGLNATQQDAVNIANLMGKVMQGQVGALRRVGISFTPIEEKVLKTGNRMERAAMLAQVLKNNVGGVNEALAQTPEGKIQNMTNQWGDMYENIGIKILPILADFAGWFAQYIPLIEKLIISNIDMVQNGIKLIIEVFQTLQKYSDLFIAALVGIATIAVVANINNIAWAILGLGIKMGALTTSVWASVTALAAQSAALLANPMTWVAIGIGAVVAGLVLLIIHWDKVKAAVVNFVENTKSKIAELWEKVSPIFNKIAEIAQKAFQFTPLGMVINATRTIKDKFEPANQQSDSQKIPGFASGTQNFAGGLALVGEKGPELVSLPSQTRIFNNQDTIDIFKNSAIEKYHNVIKIDDYVTKKEVQFNKGQSNNSDNNEDNVIYLEIELNAPDGYEAKVVNARTSIGREFKVKLRGKRKQ